MVVKVKSGRLGMMGLHIGSGDVQRFFPPDVPLIELLLDHLRIVCTLEPDFWDGSPEIHDERLDSWLALKRGSGKLASKAGLVAMIPAGEHAFRLLPIDRKEERAAKYALGFAT
jgi:hypothetical protein